MMVLACSVCMLKMYEKKENNVNFMMNTQVLRRASVAALCAVAMSFAGCSKSDAPKDSEATAASRAQIVASDVAGYKAALMDVVAQYRAAVDAKNYDQIVALSMPPTFLGYFAKMAGTDIETMRSGVSSQMGAMMSQIERFEYTFDEDNIRFETLPDGSVFARMPLDVTMVISGQTITAKDHNIGLYEDGRWHLVRVSEPELARMFKEAYPQFKDIEFAQTQMSIAE